MVDDVLVFDDGDVVLGVEGLVGEVVFCVDVGIVVRLSMVREMRVILCIVLFLIWLVIWNEFYVLGEVVIGCLE